MELDKKQKEEMQEAYGALLILYEQDKREELAKIRDSADETNVRKIMAHKLLQLGPDPRRNIWIDINKKFFSDNVLKIIKYSYK